MASRDDGRIAARPGTPSQATEPGLHPLELGGTRAFLYVPAGYRADAPAPLVLSLHGAGGGAQQGLYPLQALADGAGFALLTVGSAGRTWDVIRGGFGPDVEAVDGALAHVFGRVAVDPERVVASGFSDGASYALSLGITNGDLFTHVAAFSPGFMAPASQHGAPASSSPTAPATRCSPSTAAAAAWCPCWTTRATTSPTTSSRGATPSPPTSRWNRCAGSLRDRPRGPQTQSKRRGRGALLIGTPRWHPRHGA